jgi:hypothetical protein
MVVTRTGRTMKVGRCVEERMAVAKVETCERALSVSGV